MNDGLGMHGTVFGGRAISEGQKEGRFMVESIHCIPRACYE